MSVDTSDLFVDFIDGDDVYSSIFDELELPSSDDGVPLFDCLGEVNVKEIKINTSGYFYSSLSPDNLLKRKVCKKSKRESFILFGKAWDKGTCLINFMDELFKLASMELMTLDDASVIHCGSVAPSLYEDNKKKYCQIRKDCMELCIFLNDYLSRLIYFPEYHWDSMQEMVDKVSKKINSLKKQLGKITHLPEYIYQFCAHSQGNRCEEAGYHVVHCRFDLCWMDLHLSETVRLAASRSNQTSHLQHHYLPLFRDLFDLALARFNKIDHKDVLNKSPFSCTCVQELWIMLQILTDSDSKNNFEKGFWSYFEYLILSFLKLRTSGLPESIEMLTFILDSSHFSPTNSHLFGMWFIYHVGWLYTFNQREIISNYTLLEAVVKSLMNQEIYEKELCTCLYFIEKICLELWEPKTEILLILWEYFQKRLNQLFYTPGQELDSVATIGKSALNFLTQVKGRLEDPYLVKNSYEHFLRIVGLHLQRCNDSQSQRHWNLMTGRIYSKLTLQKLLTLNQTGEHHFVSLFLTLALSADLNQVTKKYSEICAAYSASKGGLSCELLKGQLALCILLVEQGKQITLFITPLIRSLEVTNIDRNKELFSITINAFSDILDHHHSLTLGQHLFIDGWIARYLTCSSPGEAAKLLDVLHSLVIRVKRYIEVDSSEEMMELVERLWTHVGGYLMSSSTKASYVILADIAANLASIYLGLSNSSRFSNIISFFSDNQYSDVKLVQRFIIQLLENNKVKDVLTDLDQLIIETWLKSNLVCSEVDQSEMKILSNVLTSLPEIQKICSSSLDLVDSDEPLLEFFSAVISKYKSVTTEADRMYICGKVSTYLKDMDKWLKPVLSACQSSQTISKLYYTVGSIFTLLSQLLYTKSKPNNMIHSLINLMLLPVSAHNSEGKIHSYILIALRKTLHLFLQGLNNLEPSGDAYIGRCVKEIITVYIPRCLANTGPLPSQHHISSFSLIAIFNEFESSLTELILKNISLVFFRPKARSPPTNAIHAIRYIKEILHLHAPYEHVLLALLKHSMESICDIIMYCDNKTSVYIMSKDVLKLFFENNLLKRSNILSCEVEELLSHLCISHLAWSSRQLFDLLYLLSSYIPIIIRKFLPRFLQHIQTIETKRGVSADKILRLGYERIQTKVSHK